MNDTEPFSSDVFVEFPSTMDGSVSMTSCILFAATDARGIIMRIITSIRNAIITCTAYDENTIILENSVSFSMPEDLSMMYAPTQ